MEHASLPHAFAPMRLIGSSDSAFVTAAIGIRHLLIFGALRCLEMASQTTPALLIVVLQLWALQRVLHDPWNVIYLHIGNAPSQLYILTR